MHVEHTNARPGHAECTHRTRRMHEQDTQKERTGHAECTHKTRSNEHVHGIVRQYGARTEMLTSSSVPRHRCRYSIDARPLQPPTPIGAHLANVGPLDVDHLLHHLLHHLKGRAHDIRKIESDRPQAHRTTRMTLATRMILITRLTRMGFPDDSARDWRRGPPRLTFSTGLST
jgi:hypothetical protein